MSGLGLALVGALVAAWVVMGGLVEAVELLECGRGCTCQNKTEQFDVVKYEVICEDATEQELTLTEAVLNGASTSLMLRTYVKVKSPSERTRVVVTEGFVKQWKVFEMCSLEVEGGQLLLPEAVEIIKSEKTYSEGTLELLNVTVDVIPSGLFSGKNSARLRLIGCYVGRLSSGLMDQVNFLQCLHINNSVIGVFEGPLSSEALVLRHTRGYSDVKLLKCTFGKLATGAIKFHTSEGNDIVLEEVTVGEVAAGALDARGKGKLVMKKCRIADLHQNALRLQDRILADIANNTLIVRPGGLSQLQCSFHAHHIDSNSIMVIPALSGLNELDNLRVSNDTIHSKPKPETFIHDVLVEVLRKALHPSCVEYNLPVWLPPTTLFSSPEPLHKRDTTLHKGLYSFVAVSVTAMVVVVVLACLLVQTRRRRSAPRTNNQVVVMSQLQEDPIYEDPDFHMMAPPVPLPSAHLAEACGGKTADTSSGSNHCSAETPLQEKAVENQYVSMCKFRNTPS
ncbi:uncharacterized protein [Cherax quadricarinatus]